MSEPDSVRAGGMGEVYRARDTRLDRTVAIKVLNSALSASPDLKARFEREARAISQLNHPHICTLHDVGTSEGTDFLVMEFLEGETLAQRLERGPLPIKQALTIGMDIADALDKAHGAGIVHRDVKPGNVMLTNSGAKLLDFGLAKPATAAHGAAAAAGGGTTPSSPTMSVAAANDSAPQLTGVGAFIGTLQYMSPEQAEGKSIDSRSDVFSLGAVLYEMFSGRRAFGGDSQVSTLAALLRDQPFPLKTVRREIPEGVERTVFRCLAKDPEARYANAGQVRDALAECQARLAGRGLSAAAVFRRPGMAATVASAVMLAIALGGWWWVRQSRARWAREVALPEIRRLIDQGKMYPAFELFKAAARAIPDDPEVARLRGQVTYTAAIRSTPAGAEISIRDYLNTNTPWKRVGTTPIERLELPIASLRMRVTKAGFETLDVHSIFQRDAGLTLEPAGTRPAAMVRAAGGAVQFALGPRVDLQDYWLDTYEVTNRAYKAFVDAGGYRRREFWKQPFLENGRELSWEEAMTRFRDATGRPGPATWELGSYPEGHGEYPVNGVSWYEAAAYAEFAGKSLPTVYHWRRASGGTFGTDIAVMSNFADQGPAPVGRFQGVGPFGTYDMAGNVKEWTFNEGPGGRYILGGAWTDPLYGFGNSDVQDPFKRLPTFGFRCARYPHPPPEEATRPVKGIIRDYSLEKPVSDEVFAAYRSIYAYDRTELDPRLERTDNSAPYWRVERVSYRAAYGNERIPAILFLPKNASPPYQCVIYFPGSDAQNRRSSEDLGIDLLTIDFVIRSGRAVLFPVYRGTFERGIGDYESGSNIERDLIIEWTKEVSRSRDYLETRADIDHARVAYYGFSWGALLGPIYTAVDPRFRASILLSGGLDYVKRPPEVETINFAPRSAVPTLMVNGRYDFRFPYESSQLPLFNLLGTPTADKAHTLSEDGHVPARNAMVREILDWLDRYLGTVK